MKITRHAFALGGFILFLLFVSPDATYSQALPPRSYIFAEVQDTKGKAIEGATVAVSDHTGETNKDGAVQASVYCPSGGGYLELRVSKLGYVTSENIVFPCSYSDLANAFQLKSDFPGSLESGGVKPPPIIVVLLKTPTTEKERRVVEAVEEKNHLLLAVKKDDAPGLRTLLQSGVSANTSDAKGVPAIAWAAFVGASEAIEELLDAGAKVRSGNRRARHALLIYLAEGIHREETRLRYSGGEALKQLRGRQEETVRRLLNAGAEINVRGSGAVAALNLAIRDSLSIETLKALIVAGADVNGADNDGETPLMAAAEKPSDEAVRLLLAKGARSSVNAKDKKGWTALLSAASTYQTGSMPDIVKTLIAAGANVNVANDEGETALMMAAAAGSVETTKILLAAGATINAKDRQGQTALMFASEIGGAERVKTLIDSGASVSARDDHGRTALMYAAKNLYALEALAAAGSDVNAFDDEGQTALMIAAQARTAETITALLKAGASVNAEDKHGRTALMYVKPEYYMNSATAEAVKALLAAGADVNAVDEDGRTPLMFAATSATDRAEEIIKILLGAGASINAKDRQGRTALILAAPNPVYNYDAVRVLIDSGADVNAADDEGRTALMLAAEIAPATYYGDVNVKLLLAAGAKVDLVDKEGQTAIAHARKVNNFSIVALLEAAAAKH